MVELEHGSEPTQEAKPDEVVKHERQAVSSLRRQLLRDFPNDPELITVLRESRLKRNSRKAS